MFKTAQTFHTLSTIFATYDTSKKGGGLNGKLCYNLKARFITINYWNDLKYIFDEFKATESE